MALYRIAQEALTNVAKHAQASRVDLMLESRDHSIVLVVEDDGVGFDIEDPRAGSAVSACWACASGPASLAPSYRLSPRRRRHLDLRPSHDCRLVIRTVMKRIRVLLVDDHETVRQGLRMALESQSRH